MLAATAAFGETVAQLTVVRGPRRRADGREDRLARCRRCMRRTPIGGQRRAGINRSTATWSTTTDGAKKTRPVALQHHVPAPPPHVLQRHRHALVAPGQGWPSALVFVGRPDPSTIRASAWRSRGCQRRGRHQTPCAPGAPAPCAAPAAADAGRAWRRRPPPPFVLVKGAVRNAVPTGNRARQRASVSVSCPGPP